VLFRSLCSAGSIGGGHLEARALEIAAELLNPSAAAAQARHVERFALAASLGQCCGGVVELYWERFDAPEALPAPAGAGAQGSTQGGELRGCALDGSGRSWRMAPAEALAAGWDAAALAPLAEGAARAALLTHAGGRWFIERLGDDATPLWLYGAGHVGRALVGVLADLPFRLTWVDSRPDRLDEALALAQRRAPERAIAALSLDAPEDAVPDAPAGAWHLIMTHSHDEDFRLVEALLRRSGPAAPARVAMLGSQAKATRFRQRLRQRGLDEAAIARLISPIGRGEIASKLPAAIAVALAAQLLVWREQPDQAAQPSAAPFDRQACA
jgi:xanthine dehydrogenase accessory factor